MRFHFNVAQYQLQQILIDSITESWARRDIKAFWKDIWEQDTVHSVTAPFIQREYEKTKNIVRLEWKKVTQIELKTAINFAAN